MAGKVSADNALGQVLICLRMSKLNFVARETPYSAYVTIRKKFVKHVEGEVIDNINVENEVIDKVNIEAESVNMDKRTITNLNEKIKDLLTRNAMLAFEKEEMEVKYETLEKSKIDMDDSIEEVFARNRELSKLNENLVNENGDLKADVERAKIELGKEASKASKKTKLLEDSKRDLEERVLMGENIIESRDLEITQLKKNCMPVPCGKSDDKVETVSKETEYLNSIMQTVHNFTHRKDYKCDECDFEARFSEDLKMHIHEKHQLQCQDCHENFNGRKKLDNHMCRLHIENPSFGDMYVKNWVIKNECVRVFSKHLQKEIAIIHSDVCVEKHTCTYVLPDSVTQPRYKDTTGFIHLHSSELINNREVKWAILAEMVNI